MNYFNHRVNGVNYTELDRVFYLSPCFSVKKTPFTLWLKYDL